MQGATDHQPAARGGTSGAAGSAPSIMVEAFGLRFASDRAIPGARIAQADGQGAALTIAAGEARLDDADIVAMPYRYRPPSADAGAALLFTPPGVAHYLCRPDQGILISPDPAADDAMVSALLVATALPALMWMRGGFMLHASAFIAIGQTEAIALSAPSGGGKSTLLAEALVRGAQLLADDSLCLDANGATLTGCGLPCGYFTHDRRFVAVPGDQQCAAAPLGTLVILDRAPGHPPGIAPLTGVAALEALLQARHRPRVPALVADRAQSLANAARIASRLSILKLSTGPLDAAATLDLLYRELAL